MLGVYVGLFQKELGFDSNNIVIIKNETSFKKPVTKDIVCHTKKPSFEEIKTLKQKLEIKKRDRKSVV